MSHRRMRSEVDVGIVIANISSGRRGRRSSELESLLHRYRSNRFGTLMVIADVISDTE